MTVWVWGGALALLLVVIVAVRAGIRGRLEERQRAESGIPAASSLRGLLVRAALHHDQEAFREWLRARAYDHLRRDHGASHADALSEIGAIPWDEVEVEVEVVHG